MIKTVGKKILSVEDIEDKKISWAAVMYLLTQAINMTIKTVLPIPENFWGMISAFFGVVILFYFIRVFRTVYKRVKNIIYVSYGAFSFIFLVSALLITLREEPLTVLTNPYIITVFVFWLPTGICAAAIKNYEILYNTFLKSSYIIFFLAIWCFWGEKIESENENIYNMQMGFSLIIPTLFHLNEVFKRRYKFLFLFAIEVIIIIIYANRGVLLSLAFFTFYKVFVDHKNLFFSFLILVFSVFLLANLQSISLSVLDFLSRYHLSSRTLLSIVNDTLQESTGREEIWGICNNMLLVHPVTGWGVGGECYEIYKELGSLGNYGYGNSPHNALLQFLLQFGIIGGLIAIFLFLIPIFKMHLIKDINRNHLLLVLCSSSVIPCCYSAGDVFLKPAIALYFFLYYCKSINKY